MGGDAKVAEQSKDIVKDLDKHLTMVKEQCATLDASLSQIDRYNQVRCKNQDKCIYAFLYLNRKFSNCGSK
jgi:hypothetical protein